MSLNFENDGIQIAVIKKDDKNSKKNKIVYLDEHSSSHNSYKKLTLKDKDEKFYLLPDISKNRSIYFIAGSSGSGKSYKASEIANEYKKYYPKNDIYLLSYIDSDSSIERVKDIQRIHLNDDFINEELDAETFENSLVIFDDTDCITEKKMKNKIKDLLIKLLNTGRHYNVSVIYLSHMPYGLENKQILNESHVVIFFSTLGGRAKSYLLQSYLGLNKKQIDALESVEGRSISIIKSYPMVMVADREICLIKYLDKN
jgi:hypothetical protein